MKITLLALLSLITFHAGAQHLIHARLVDSATRQPLAGVWFERLENGDRWIDVGQADSNGYLTAKTGHGKYRRSATYALLIEDDAYDPVVIPVQPGSAGIVTIGLTKAPDHFPQDSQLFYKDCGSTWFGYYKPKRPRSLADLPPPIRDSVIKYLTGRLGDDFTARLKLTDGQIVDRRRLLRIDKTAKNYRWTPQAYYLCFSFRDTAAGIARYPAEMALDKEGAVREAIAMPDIRLHPEKGALLPMAEIKKIVQAAHCDPGKMYSDFDYDPQAECFVWTFEEARPGHTTLRIAAHSGEVLERR